MMQKRDIRARNEILLLFFCRRLVIFLIRDFYKNVYQIENAGNYLPQTNKAIFN